MTFISSQESIYKWNGFEFLTYFVLGKPDRPLVLFFPGWGHLGRIAYGGADIPADEFLAPALHEKGFSFLAISYPLQNKIYSSLYPQMEMKDWAEAAAKMMQEACHIHSLSSVIAIHWSAAGQFVTTFHQAAKATQCNHLFSVALEATPPIILGPDHSHLLEIQPSGLVSARKLYANWHRKLSAMLSVPLDSAAYEEAFLGAFPLCLSGTPSTYSNGKICDDMARCIQDRNLFNYADAPLVLSINGNAKNDPYHPLVDRASWTFMNERKIYHDFLAPSSAHLASLSEDNWTALRQEIRKFSADMIHEIEGNHFILIGKKRTHRIASLIEKSEAVVANLLDKIALYRTVPGQNNQ